MEGEIQMIRAMVYALLINGQWGINYDFGAQAERCLHIQITESTNGNSYVIFHTSYFTCFWLPASLKHRRNKLMPLSLIVS